MDHRLGTRVNLAVPARLRFQDGRRATGMVLNVGQGGLFVRTAAPAQVNGCLELRMRVVLPQGKQFLRLSACVVHVSAQGLGLMFRELDNQATEIMDWLLKPVERSDPYRQFLGRGGSFIARDQAAYSSVRQGML